METIKKVKFTLEQLFKDIKIVNYKTFKGHDADQFSCDIKYKGKKITNVWDDSWGGGYKYTNQKGIKELFDQTQLENDTIEEWYNLDCFCQDLINMHLELKEDKRGIILNATNRGFEIFQWKQPLQKMFDKWGDKFLIDLQKNVDQLLKEGNTIRNKTYLKSLGVKFK